MEEKNLNLPPIITEFLKQLNNDATSLETRLRVRDTLKNISDVVYKSVKQFDHKHHVKTKK